MKKLDCTQFVLKVGLDTALQIFGEQVWDKTKLTFEQWSSKTDCVDHVQVFDAKVLAKLVETASTGNHWLQLWGMAPADRLLRLMVIEKIKEELKTLITFNQVVSWRPISLALDFQGEWKELNAVWLERLAEVASRLWDWKTVRDCALNSSYNNNDLAAQALTKMVDYATSTGTAEDWESVYHATPLGSHTKQALAYFSSKAKTFEDWHRVWYRARDKDSDLAKRAWQKAVARASTFQEWRSVLWQNKENDAVTQELCASKVRKLAKTFEDWCGIYSSSSIDGGMKADALVQMLASAKTLDDWLNVLYWTPKGSEVKAQALMQVRSFISLE